jgi:hypothetical protein
MPRQLQQRRRVAYQTAVIIGSPAWTELVIAAAFIFFMIPWTRGKRFLARGFLLSTVPLLLYFAVGWNSGSRIFAAVRTFRSQFDADGRIDEVARRRERRPSLHV